MPRALLVMLSKTPLSPSQQVNPGRFFLCCPWRTSQIHGNRLIIQEQVSEEARYKGDYYYYNIMTCARAGLYGRLTPLLTELPPSRALMANVTLTAISAGENFAVFPFLCALHLLSASILMSSVQ